MNKTLLMLLAIISLQLNAKNRNKIKDSSKDHYNIPMLNSRVSVDGFVDEREWGRALKLNLNYEVSPGDNTPATVKTEAFLYYSKTHLYIAFKAYDPDPSKIRARITDRDKFDGDDWVGVVLDTYNDQRRCLDFMCNPYGIQTDAIESNNDFDEGWNTIWHSNGKITNFGYCVEMAIPFNSIRFQNKNGDQQWGFDLIRGISRKKRRQMGFFPRDRNNNCLLCQTPKLIGFKGVRPGRNIELDPTLSVVMDQERRDETSGPFDWKNKRLEPGITGKWGITPNLTLNATLNPDFSQVESDRLQMDINNPFALHYPERRPFFMEASDFFQTPLPVVYTRSIREPLWGTKLTGKEGEHSVGVYMLQDRKTNFIFPGSQESDTESLDQNSYSTILRYKKDFGNRVTIGGITTGRQSEDYHNVLYGVDGDVRLTKSDKVIFQLMNTETSYSDSISINFDQRRAPFAGYAGGVAYIHESKHLEFELAFKEIDNDFRADLGYIPQVNYREYNAELQYTFYPKSDKTWWNRFFLEAEYEKMVEQSGNFLKSETETRLMYLGNLQSHSFIEHNYIDQNYDDVIFSLNQYTLHHCMKPFRNWFFAVTYSFGDGIDFKNTRSGKYDNIMLYTNISFGKNLSSTLRYSQEKFRVNNKKLYTADMAEAQIVYQFNKRCFVRTILQFRNYDYNSDNYLEGNKPEDSRKKFLNTQFLFSYKINPQTMIYIGYSDKHFGSHDVSMVQTNRSFFMKFGYAFLL